MVQQPVNSKKPRLSAKDFMATRLEISKRRHLVRFVRESTDKENMEAPFLRRKKGNRALLQPAIETTTWGGRYHAWHSTEL
jgi:hypothetical protein